MGKLDAEQKESIRMAIKHKRAKSARNGRLKTKADLRKDQWIENKLESCQNETPTHDGNLIKKVICKGTMPICHVQTHDFRPDETVELHKNDFVVRKCTPSGP